MAFGELGFFKLLKPVLGFDHKRPWDVISLVLILISSIFLLVTGAITIGFVFYAGIFVIFYALRFVAYIFSFLFSQIPSHLTFGFMHDRRFRKLNDQQKFIITGFVEQDSMTCDFNLQNLSEVNFQRLKEQGWLSSYSPTVPSNDINQLEHALGRRFIEATLKREIFDYYTVNHCKNALAVGMILHRADVRRHWRNQG